MEIFIFKARTEAGEIVEDAIQGNSKEEVALAIKSKGLVLLTLKKQPKVRGLFTKGISTSDKASLCRFIATMLRSGMSLPETVDIIKDESKNKKLKKILADISFQTQRGKSLSAVLSQYPRDFDSVFLTMVKVGEESGTLEKSFDYLAKQLDASHELQQKVIGSLMYPAVIVIAMLGNGLLMFVFVLPRIASAFLKLELPLPAYTKIILTVGQFFGNNVPFVLGSMAILVVLISLLIFIKSTRNILIYIFVKFPVLRKIVQQLDIARFSRTFSTLLKSGVPIITALDVSAGTLTQKSFRREAEQFSKGVEKGRSLSEILMQNRKMFPSTMIQTIRAGEKSGSLEQVLEEMATFYEREVEFSLKRFTALLEPVLMLLIGVVVGIMVIMMIAPIYSIIGGLQQTIKQ